MIGLLRIELSAEPMLYYVSLKKIKDYDVLESRITSMKKTEVHMLLLYLKDDWMLYLS